MAPNDTQAAADGRNTFPVTFFHDQHAKKCRRLNPSLPRLRDWILSASAPTKDKLPWLKFATFGDKRTKKGCLRNDDNVIAITEVELDYDDEKISFEETVEIITKAHLKALVYTSPRHTAAAPRWRILAPTSIDLPPAERVKLIKRVNGLFNGVMAGESFTLSQSFYYGRIGKNPDHRAVVIDGDFIDCRADLDEGAIDKPPSKSKQKGNGKGGQTDDQDGQEEKPRSDWSDWVGNIVRGESLHDSTRDLAAGMMALSQDEAAVRMLEALLLNADMPRDERWDERFDDIGNLVQSAEKKFGAENTAPAAPIAEPPQVEWPTLDEAALYGLAGDVVRTIEPHTEADPVAILIQFLAVFGNAIGGDIYIRVESDRHRGNLFVTIVGETAKGRKGISFGRAKAVMGHADQNWTDERIINGLSTGEGLINAVRDARTEFDKKKGEDVTIDAGIRDKRLLAIEPEFARVLSAASRTGNTLNAVLRDAWDRQTLSVLTKTSPLRAHGVHISVVGHISVAELRCVLTDTDVMNGFANRFLFVLARRSKLLPFGGSLDDAELVRLGERVRERIEGAQWTASPIEWTHAAADEWRAAYGELSKAGTGMFGAATARGEAQCIRLAMLYAVLDGKHLIDVEHLRAAVAVWRYAEASARYVFGGVLGDPIADEILAALRMAGTDGMPRTDIRDLFSRNAPSSRVHAALSLLQQAGKARREVRTKARGRPAEFWIVC